MRSTFVRIIDEGTDIFAVAFVIDCAENIWARAQMAKHGWGVIPETNYLFLMKLTPDVEVQSDPFKWSANTGGTMRSAHILLQELFHLGGLEAIEESMRSLNSKLDIRKDKR